MQQAAEGFCDVETVHAALDGASSQSASGAGVEEASSDHSEQSCSSSGSVMSKRKKAAALTKASQRSREQAHSFVLPRNKTSPSSAKQFAWPGR